MIFVHSKIVHVLTLNK